MPKYFYDGPVMEFNTCIANHWKGETFAPSESKVYLQSVSLRIRLISFTRIPFLNSDNLESFSL